MVKVRRATEQEEKRKKNMEQKKLDYVANFIGVR